MRPVAGFKEGQMSRSALDNSGKSRGQSQRPRSSTPGLVPWEMVKIEAAAQAAELTVSAFMRSLILEGAGVRPFFTEEDRVIVSALFADLRAVGVNLNQLARAANRRKPRTDEERAVIDGVRRAIAALLYEISFFADRGARMREGKA